MRNEKMEYVKPLDVVKNDQFMIDRTGRIVFNNQEVEKIDYNYWVCDMGVQPIWVRYNGFTAWI